MKKKRKRVHIRARKIPDLKSILSAYVRDNKLNKALDNVKVLNSWTEIVGERISAVSEPVKFSNNILYVKIKNSAWRNEMFMLEKDIIMRINGYCGKFMVKKILFI